MSKKKDSRVTIANWLAIIGLAAIAVVVFFGFLLKSEDGTIGVPAILTALIVAGLTFFLVMSIKAKSADNNPEKWKFIEWGALAGYLAVAALSAPAFLHFMGVFSNKEKLQAMANEEVSALLAVYDDYDKQRTTQISNAANTYLEYNNKYKPANGPISEIENLQITNLKQWQSDSETITSMKKEAEKLKEMKNSIDSWKLLELSKIAKDLADEDTIIKSKIEEKIKQFGTEHQLIPVINKNPYSYGGLYQFKIKDGPSPRFADALRNNSGTSVLGWVLLVVAHLLVLLCYVVTRRANYVRPKNNTSVTGIDL